MTDRPILMSAPMVRALLDGRKTQTRRLAWRSGTRELVFGEITRYQPKPTIWQSVKPGDRLWVRETWVRNPDFADINSNGFVIYRADPGHDYDGPFKPSIHMPRWASRITLVVTATRMERLRGMLTWRAAVAEGMPNEGRPNVDGPREKFAELWKTLHPKPGDRWEDNPEVVALTFTVHQRNIDAMENAA